MRRMRKSRWSGVAAAALFLFAAARLWDGAARGQPAGGRAVDVKVVNYQQLGSAIKLHKGKVVVVDLWGIT